VPNLVFIPCDFNADKPTPKDKPEIVLDGWNIKDTKHNIFNSLIWGPDGWLYGCNGIQSKSFVAKPGTPMTDRTEFNCGVWRYHPTRKIFEPFAHGTTNPFGLDFDEYGEAFITNCVIKHLFHVIPGGHFDRMYGQDVNPHVYKLMPSIADYIHWAGGDWTSSRGNKPEHSDAGGGHAHSGCMVYLGDNFPDEYRNCVFTCNIHGNRINRDVLKRHGSGYKSERAKDFMFANDPWFRGIAIHYGPDGGVFVSDWCDTGECHNYDKVDASNGRIHKIVYGTPKAWKGDLSKLSDLDLIKLLSHKNEWFASHARRVLHERQVSGTIDKGTIDNLASAFREAQSSITRLRLAFARHTLGDARTGLELNQRKSDEYGEARGIRMWLDDVAAGKNMPAINQPPAPFFYVADKPVKRLSLASAIMHVPVDERFGWAQRLLHSVEARDESDSYIALLSWYAIEPLIGNDRTKLDVLLGLAKLPLLREFIARKATMADHANMSLLVSRASEATDSLVSRDLLQGIIDGLGGARQIQSPSDWVTAGPKFLKSSDRAVRERAMILAVIFNDESAIASMKKTASDPKGNVGNRSMALRTLLRRGKPDILPLLWDLVNDKDLRSEAVRGLAAFKDPATPGTLLVIYDKFSESEKEDVIQTLASRAEWALIMLDAMEANVVPRRDLSVFVARQMQGLKDKRVGERLARVWGQIQPASAQRTELTKKYKSILNEESLKKSDMAKGRQLYVKNCAACHKLYDDGGDIGPALTGSQRSNIDYILENVLDPSAVVPRDYQVTVIDLKSERRINGIVKQETPKSLTVQTTNETLIIPKEEIEARTQSKMSIMPDGIFDKLNEQEVRDLVAYLRGKEQVPLPKRP
jgi:putative membrane-bound dehydrogenase-like protein